MMSQKISTIALLGALIFLLTAGRVGTASAQTAVTNFPPVVSITSPFYGATIAQGAALPH